MKKTFTKWLIPVCLLIIIFTQLLTYYTKNEINGGFYSMKVNMESVGMNGPSFIRNGQINTSG